MPSGVTFTLDRRGVNRAYNNEFFTQLILAIIFGLTVEVFDSVHAGRDSLITDMYVCMHQNISAKIVLGTAVTNDREKPE